MDGMEADIAQTITYMSYLGTHAVFLRVAGFAAAASN